MPTLQEIIDFEPVGQGDGYDITDLMNNVARADAGDTTHEHYHEYKGTQITAGHVVDVSYDGRRGARTTVLRFNTVPFAIISAAGRELDDVVNIYIIDAEYAIKALNDWRVPPEFNDIYNREADIGLAFWEGTEVDLGDKGWKEPYP